LKWVAIDCRKPSEIMVLSQIGTREEAAKKARERPFHLEASTEATFSPYEIGPRFKQCIEVGREEERGTRWTDLQGFSHGSFRKCVQVDRNPVWKMA
jgi:hypothetical protein